MRKTIGLALVALPLVVLPAQANGPYSFTVGASAGFTFYAGPGGAPCGPNGCGPAAIPAQLGPWYLYWPMEAHFNAPAPTGYPYWPAPQALPNGASSVPPGDHGHAFHANYQPQAPAYWYGR